MRSLPRCTTVGCSEKSILLFSPYFTTLSVVVRVCIRKPVNKGFSADFAKWNISDASVGMDALTHAIEGYTTKAAWEMTDMFHLKAIEIIARSLRSAVANEKEGRDGMALGEYIAGMGFSNVGLGIAHSMAHTLGAVYDTPHGVACAMMLPIVMEYNADCTGEKYREIARAMGVKGVDDMSVEEYRKAAIDAVAQLSVDVGIPTKLEAIKEDDLDFLAESAHADACAPGNPKDASVEDLKALFRKIM